MSSGIENRPVRSWSSGETTYIPDGELVYLAADEPPSSGTWVDSHDDVLTRITKQEIEAGELLRELIDPNDDDDNGLQHIGGPDR